MTSVGGRVLVTAGDPVKQGLLQAVEEKLLSFPSSVLTWEEICLTPKLKIWENSVHPDHAHSSRWDGWSGVTSHKKTVSPRAARPSYITAGVHNWLLHDFFHADWLWQLTSGRREHLRQNLSRNTGYMRVDTHTHTSSAPLCSVATSNHPSSSHTHSVLTSDGCARNFAGAARHDGWACADVLQWM